MCVFFYDLRLYDCQSFFRKFLIFLLLMVIPQWKHDFSSALSSKEMLSLVSNSTSIISFAFPEKKEEFNACEKEKKILEEKIEKQFSARNEEREQLTTVIGVNEEKISELEATNASLSRQLISLRAQRESLQRQYDDLSQEHQSFKVSNRCKSFYFRSLGFFDNLENYFFPCPVVPLGETRRLPLLSNSSNISNPTYIAFFHGHDVVFHVTLLAKSFIIISIADKYFMKHPLCRFLH